MSLPGGASGFTLTGGTYDDSSFQGMAGVLTMSAAVTHVATGERIRKTWNFSIDYTGNFSIGPLPFTDDPAFSPTGFTYTVTWQAIAWRDTPGNLTFQVPRAAGATVDFDSLIPVTGANVSVPFVHGIPAGGTSGQVLAKASGTDYDVTWAAQTGGGGGGAVASVNGKTGAVTLAASDVGADASGAATAAQAAAIAAAATDATSKANAAQAAAISASAGQVTDAAMAGAWGSSTGAKVAADATVRAAFVAASQLLLSDTRPGNPATGLVRIGLAVSGSDTTAPSTPTNLAVVAGNAQNSLSWTASTDNVAVTGYKVRRGGTVVGTPTGTSYTDTGLTNGTTYSYTVSAVDAAANESAQTSAVTGTPTAGATAPGQPTGLTAGTPTSSGVPLTWTAPASNGGSAITDYVVQYRTTAGPGTWTTFADGTSTVTSATVTGLTASTSYDFQVAAVNSVGQGGYSATATASTAAASGAGTNPTSVAGLSALWSADTLGLTDGAEVTSFPSSAGSGTNNALIQSAGSGPIYHAAVQNSLPALHGDGSRTMFTSATMSPAIATTGTVFVVGRWSTFANGATLLDGDSTNTYRLYASSGTAVSMFTGGSGTPDYTLPNPTGWHVFAIRRNGTGSNGLQLWVDGTMVGQATATTTTTVTQFHMFGIASSATGDIGEVVAYNTTALSDADMLGVARYLGAKWGITTA
jgi:hypothetical protein